MEDADQNRLPDFLVVLGSSMRREVVATVRIHVQCASGVLLFTAESTPPAAPISGKILPLSCLKLQIAQRIRGVLLSDWDRAGASNG